MPIKTIWQSASGFWNYRPNRYNHWMTPTKPELLALIAKSRHAVAA